VQNLIPLDRWPSQKPLSGQITVTIGKFYRVTGESTQHRGVEPDVQLPSAIDMTEVGESALEAALPWDRIQPAPFAAWHNEHPVIALPSLVSEETTREQHDPDYRYLVDDVAALNKVRAEKTLSLNRRCGRAAHPARQRAAGARQSAPARRGAARGEDGGGTG